MNHFRHSISREHRKGLGGLARTCEKISTLLPWDRRVWHHILQPQTEWCLQVQPYLFFICIPFQYVCCMRKNQRFVDTCPREACILFHRPLQQQTEALSTAGSCYHMNCMQFCCRLRASQGMKASEGWKKVSATQHFSVSNPGIVASTSPISHHAGQLIRVSGHCGDSNWAMTA